MAATKQTKIYEISLREVQEDGLNLKSLSRDLQYVPEIVMAAVQQNGMALEYASERLKNDKDIVLAAIKQDRRALKYVSAKLKDDMERVLTLASKEKVGRLAQFILSKKLKVLTVSEALQMRNELLTRE